MLRMAINRAFTRFCLLSSQCLNYSLRGRLPPSIPAFSLGRSSSASSSFVLKRASSCVADWTPPYRVSSFDDAENFRGKSTFDGQHYLVSTYMKDVHFKSEQDLFKFYIDTLAKAVGSEQEAEKRIYLVSCGWRYGFGAKLDDDSRFKLQGRFFCYVQEDHNFNARNADPRVQSAIRFTPVNPNNRLDSIFTYHHQRGKCLNSKWNSDHWLINIKQPDGNKGQIGDYCIKMLAEVVGSEEEARKNLYVIWFKSPFGFGAEIDEEAANKLRGRLDVLKVIPDHVSDIKDSIHGPLRILSSSHGLRLSCYHPTKDNSEDWLVSMDEYVGESHEFYSISKYDSYNLYPVECGTGCKKWVIVMEKCGGEFASIQHKVAYGVQTLARVIGREESVKRKIYRIQCGQNSTVFGIKLDEDTSKKLKDDPIITAVLEDNFDDAKNSYFGIKSSPSSAEVDWNLRLKDLFCYHELSGCNPEWKSDHWLIHMKQPYDKFQTEQEIIEFCIRMLAEVLGSDEDPRGKIYLVWCKRPFGFGAAIDEETSNKLKGRPDVLNVLPDYAFDIKNRNHGVIAISPSVWVDKPWQTVNRGDLFHEVSDSDSDEVSD